MQSNDLSSRSQVIHSLQFLRLHFLLIFKIITMCNILNSAVSQLYNIYICSNENTLYS